MSTEPSGIYTGDVEEIVEELRQEFLDETRDGVRGITLAIEDVRHGRSQPEDLLGRVRRFGVRTRGQAVNVGMRLIGTVTHRLEDFVAAVKAPPPRFLEDLQAFADCLDDIVNGVIPLDSDASTLVRTLPAKMAFDLGEIEIRNVEVMLVMLHGTQTRFVEREMHQCGYRTTVVTSTFEALPLIVRTKPEMVIVSAVMPELDGINLAVALASMPATRNIPVALITSLDPEDEHLRFLPKVVPVIHKGPSFGDDLAEALSRLFII